MKIFVVHPVISLNMGISEGCFIFDFITFGGRSAHLAYHHNHVPKSAYNRSKTPIIIILPWFQKIISSLKCDTWGIHTVVIYTEFSHILENNKLIFQVLEMSLNLQNQEISSIKYWLWKNSLRTKKPLNK